MSRHSWGSSVEAEGKLPDLDASDVEVLRLGCQQIVVECLTALGPTVVEVVVQPQSKHSTATNKRRDDDLSAIWRLDYTRTQ